MLQDTITLIEGANITNATIASGTSNPSNPSTGELFFRTDLSGLYVYDGSTWAAVGGSLGYTPVNKAGDTMTGFLTLNADPTNALHASTKQYVDSLAA
jgi:hypothetical protein